MADSDRSENPIALSLLGGFHLAYSGAVLTLPVHAQRLVAFIGLAEEGNRTLTAGTLWPEVGEKRALGNLRSTLWRLHAICPSVVVASRNDLRLAASVTVDVRECRSAVAQLSSRPNEQTVHELTQGRWSGDLLPGWYEDWVLVERDRLQHARMYALEATAELLLKRGHYAEALTAALAAAHSDPLRESARRLILRVHVAEGNRVEALRQFQSYRALLAEELGMEPSPRTWALLSAPG